MSTRAGTWLLWACTACIIPDRGITFEGGPDNEFAVRILERSPLPPDMVEICNADANDPDERKKIDLTFCPPVRRTLPGGLVRSDDGGPFCICAAGASDLRAIEAFSIYAEDADLDGDSARDRLYGTFVLDPDPFGDEVEPAYDQYWSQAQLAMEIRERDTDEPEPSSGRVVPSQARDVPPQWEFRIDDGSGVVDLCNGEDIEPGLHDLQFIVTDRPWFSVPHADPDPDDDDVPTTTVPKIGVPDLAGGASYAVINYVFECVDALADPEDDPRAEDCECEDE